MFIDMNNSHDCLMSVWSLSDVSMTIITHVIAQKMRENSLSTFLKKKSKLKLLDSLLMNL